MASLCSKRSRISRYACRSSNVREFSVRGRRIHGANVCARAVTYASSADVKSISRVKCVAIASNVAILFNRSCPSVDCKTLILGAASIDSVEIGFATASDVVA